MISEKMKEYVTGSSLIRAMFEDSKKLAEIYGAENVYDFSLGNPCFPPPNVFKTTLVEILGLEDQTAVHGYMNNAGHEGVREAIADSLNRRFDTSFQMRNILMTVGAAGGINVALKTLVNPGEEIVTFSPYFGEYDSYASNVSAKLVTAQCSQPDFQPDPEELRKVLTPQTKVVIMNSPNNPTGVVYSEKTIRAIADVLREKQKEFGTVIYLFSDEPYRELVYGDARVPYVTKYYENTIVGYSYSKSLSLAGERIGYLVIPDEAEDAPHIIAAAAVANRILGFVNAPSLMQFAIGACVDVETDVSHYEYNRDLLYEGLNKIGYRCVKPEGAFYLFFESPIDDDLAFAEKAKDFRLVIVPGTAFHCPGYIRLAYCASEETIRAALPQFKKLWDAVQPGAVISSRMPEMVVSGPADAAGGEAAGNA